MSQAKPFVKWIGGKRQLLPELTPRLPKSWARYFERFVGGGALFFSLQCPNAQLTDVNFELINSYQVIKSNLTDLIAELSRHENTEEYFYGLRDADRTPEYKQHWASIQRAARFIYLNKTCFNGLYRENKSGYFNVPFGHYSNPKIVDIENLTECNRILNETDVTLLQKDFRYVVDCKPTEGDFVYLDPPYIPLSISSSFTMYNRDGFDMDDQKRLLEMCDLLDSRGVKWMQSNSSAPVVFEMYKRYNIETVDANRSVSATVAGRAKVKEVVIRNYK